MEAYARLVAQTFLEEELDSDDVSVRETLLSHLTGLALQFYQTQESVCRSRPRMEDVVQACQEGDAIRAKALWDAIGSGYLDLQPLVSYAREADCSIAPLLIGELESGKIRRSVLINYLVGDEDEGGTLYTEADLEWVLQHISPDALDQDEQEVVYISACRNGSRQLVLWVSERGLSHSQHGVEGFIEACTHSEEMARWLYGLGGFRIEKEDMVEVLTKACQQSLSFAQWVYHTIGDDRVSNVMIHSLFLYLCSYSIESDVLDWLMSLDAVEESVYWNGFLNSVRYTRTETVQWFCTQPMFPLDPFRLDNAMRDLKYVHHNHRLREAAETVVTLVNSGADPEKTEAILQYNTALREAVEIVKMRTKKSARG